MAFEIQRFADAADNFASFNADLTAQLQFTFNVDSSGNIIVGDGEAVYGTKKFTLKGISPSATPRQLYYGVAETPEIDQFGIIRVFAYIIGLAAENGDSEPVVNYVEWKKTVSYSTEAQ